MLPRMRSWQRLLFYAVIVRSTTSISKLYAYLYLGDIKMLLYDQVKVITAQGNVDKRCGIKE